MFELHEVGAFFIALLAVFMLMAFAARRRKVLRQEALVAAPTLTVFREGGSSGFYVATTFEGRPLERITAHGLGFGGRASVLVDSVGINISRVGEKSFVIKADEFGGLGKSTAVIDRAVEKDGLVSLRWKLGDLGVESHFRFPDSTVRKQLEQDIAKWVGNN